MSNHFAKKIVKGMLDHVILEACEEKPHHGYELIKLVRKKYHVYFGPSTMYPMLNKLEDEGFLKSSWNFSGERPQKQYSLTAKGHAELTLQRRDIEMILVVREHEKRGD